jgi:hypothetical protein
MSMQNSYFAVPSPLALLDQWLNPLVHHVQLSLRGNPLTVSWTRRAERQLVRQSRPLLAEMQLYFSCVVKKRVVFHEEVFDDATATLAVNDHLTIAFRPVEANSCDPLEFAANHPVRREFDSRAAFKMHPSHLHLDFKHGKWLGEFSV